MVTSQPYAPGDIPGGPAQGTDRAAVLTGDDAFDAAFTEAGTFTSDASFTAFAFRSQLPAGPEDGEQEAGGADRRPRSAG